MCVVYSQPTAVIPSTFLVVPDTADMVWSGHAEQCNALGTTNISKVQPLIEIKQFKCKESISKHSVEEEIHIDMNKHKEQVKDKI